MDLLIKNVIMAKGLLSSIIILTLVILPTNSTWWLLGTPAAYQSTLELKPTNYKKHCKDLNYLEERQKEICGWSQNILKTIGKGAMMGIEECQNQFRTRRWNCTTFNTTTVFGGILQINSREKAYIYAISAAGVAYSVTRACSKGEITECSCDKNVRQQNTEGKWEWGGCSEDIVFGESFSKDFVDSKEKALSAEGLMNLHNNDAGRMAISNNMDLICKCHGVSGSCSVKICWRKMAEFAQIGEELTEKFEGATHVRMSMKRNKLKPKIRGQKSPTKQDLVYLEESPDYCKRNLKIGVLGTKGRQCNRTSYGMDGCKLMCCGRGYHTMVREIVRDCECKFIWCCSVKCNKCREVVEEHFCN
uniref:Protein Wnt n=1 Tax=Euperipatoides kanangrensis TaxID=488523 RepID=A0A097ZRP6_9BILA|nr:WNTA protein [Euperipatoides kanangrensis]